MNKNDIIIPQWHEVNTSHIVIEENGEPLINLNEKQNNRILYEPMYFIRKIPGATTDCLLRESVYKKLVKATKLLPAGYSFKIYDAWRSYDVQKFLFDKHVVRLMSINNIPKEIAEDEARRYVSKPYKDPQRSFVHSTGGAIDLTIVDEKNVELNMGTAFDEFTSLAHTDAFETSHNSTVKYNRRLLYYVMTSVGFTNYPSEWWHYDYGDIFWASESKNMISLFGGIF